MDQDGTQIFDLGSDVEDLEDQADELASGEEEEVFLTSFNASERRVLQNLALRELIRKEVAAELKRMKQAEEKAAPKKSYKREFKKSEEKCFPKKRKY